MNKVAFTTLGCKVNQYETQAMIELFLSKRYTIVEYEQMSDIYIINTCTVTNMGDKKSRQAIRKAKRQNPDAIVVVVGCYAQTSPDEVSKIDGVNIIIGTKDRTKIVDIIENYSLEDGILNNVSDIMKTCEFEEFPLNNMKDRTRAYLKIQDGCNQFCSYCIIPYARGAIRSRQPNDILLEVKSLIANGFKEIVLTGIHIASYGKDLYNMNLLKIIEMIHDIDGLERIRFSSVEPNIITDEFLKSISKLTKVCDHIHLSLQSGCDETLLRMNRKYDTKKYYEAICNIRNYMPYIGITTDLITGFPGETDEEFEKTCDFIKKVEFSKIHVFPFSPKKGTKANSMKNQINSVVKHNRTDFIIKIQDSMEKEFLEKNKGRIMNVLFEKQMQDNLYEGYTTNYIKVIAKSNNNLKNTIIPVKMTQIKNDFIKGEILFA